MAALRASERQIRSTRASALCVLLEKFRGIADGQNRLRRIVGNLATKLFFKCHHEFDGVETVGAEVVDEARIVDHFLGLNTKVFDHDLLNPLANLTHRSTSCCFLTRPGDDYEPIVVDKLPSQPRINLIWPRCQRPMIEVLNHRGRWSQELRKRSPTEQPANDGKLRPANIQGFQILQWRS